MRKSSVNGNETYWKKRCSVEMEAIVITYIAQAACLISHVPCSISFLQMLFFTIGKDGQD